MVWWVVKCAFDLDPPVSMANMFGNWLDGIPKLLKSQLLVGVSALCWSIWLYRNDVVFDNKNLTNPLQVILLSGSWLNAWAMLQKTNQKENMLAGSQRLEFVAKQILKFRGWRLSHRICNS